MAMLLTWPRVPGRSCPAAFLSFAAQLAVALASDYQLPASQVGVLESLVWLPVLPSSQLSSPPALHCGDDADPNVAAQAMAVLHDLRLPLRLLAIAALQSLVAEAVAQAATLLLIGTCQGCDKHVCQG